MSAAPFPPPAPARILIVEDEPSVRLLLEKSLRDWGYEVTTAIDGHEAARVAESGEYAVVLTDIRMPGMDGLELTRWMRARRPATDVILMTGYASLDTAAEGMRLGASDYLLKPFAKLELVRASVERALAKQRLEHETEQLRQQLDRAERFAAIGELAAGVAHDINNPAALIDADLRMMREALAQSDLGDVEQLRSESLAAIERIAAIVRDLGDFARFDDDTPIEPVGLDEVVAAALRVTSPQLRQRAILAVAPIDVPLVRGRKSRLVHATVNLLLDAADRIDLRPGGGHIHVHACAEPPHAHLRVEHDGVLRSDAERARLLEEGAARSREGRHWLSLVIAAQIARSLDGELTATTLADGRCRFDLRVPLCESKPQPIAAPALTVTAARLRVLLVDDERFLLRAIQRMLQPSHDVLTASSGLEALAVLDREPVDAIVCDLMMPDMDGVQLHEELVRSHPALACRTVFITGGAVSARTRGFTVSSSTRVLQKPFTPQQLFDALQALATPQS